MSSQSFAGLVREAQEKMGLELAAIAQEEFVRLNEMEKAELDKKFEIHRIRSLSGFSSIDQDANSLVLDEALRELHRIANPQQTYQKTHRHSLIFEKVKWETRQMPFRKSVREIERPLSLNPSSTNNYFGQAMIGTIVDLHLNKIIGHTNIAHYFSVGFWLGPDNLPRYILPQAQTREKLLKFNVFCSLESLLKKIAQAITEQEWSEYTVSEEERDFIWLHSDNQYIVDEQPQV